MTVSDVRATAMVALLKHSPVADNPASAKAPSPSAPGVRAQRGKGLSTLDAIVVDRSRAKARTAPPREVTFYYDPGPQRDVHNVRLNGSWDKRTGKFTTQWGVATIPMTRLPDGRWSVTVRLQDDGLAHDWEWGCYIDTPTAKGKWAVLSGSNLKFDPAGGSVAYAPTTYHAMGARRAGSNDLSFKVWLPSAKAVAVRVTSTDGSVARYPLEQTGEDWSTVVKKGFDRALGAAYSYEVTERDGSTRVVADPYAFAVMGEQRGISRTYFDPLTGAEAHQYSTSQTPFMRFECVNESGADAAWVVLKDADGRQLSHDEVVARLGALDPALRAKIIKGRGGDDLTSIADDGRLRMVNEDGMWTTLVHNATALHGLRFELQQWKGGALIGDANHDGKLSDVERKKSVDNDGWSDLITDRSGIDFRESVIVDCCKPLTRSPPPVPWNEAVIYQAHVGSFFSSKNNSRRSTFDDLVKHLDYLQELGINTLEMLPVTEVPGVREWGYSMGIVNFAIENGYGFQKDGVWVSGRDALAILRAETQKRKMNLVCDVVYNHALDSKNPLADIDPKNPYYNWGTAEKPELRSTPWGPMPAFNSPRVRQYLIDHAIAQILEHGFDGIRFDFVEPIYKGGGDDGKKFLIELMNQLSEVDPGALRLPEDFSYEQWIVDLTGSLWYTEYQHRLVHDNNPDRPGLIQAAALGKRTDVDAFLKLFTSPIGLKSLAQAAIMISNHDEVGNAARTIMVACGLNPSDDPPQRARNLARFTMLIGMMSPGKPFFFQGDEFGATNSFKWGIASTWDMGWSWLQRTDAWDWSALHFNDKVRDEYERLFALGDKAFDDPAYRALSDIDKKVFADIALVPAGERKQLYVDIARRQIFACSKASINLRKDAKLFADVPATPFYLPNGSHNDDGVLGFMRGNDHVVIGNLKDARPGYPMKLPPGKWREVLNSDDWRFGGEGVTNVGRIFEGGDGVPIDLPPGGALVLERIG